MKTTVSITEGQKDFPALVRKVEKGDTFAVTRHDRTVAYLISADRFEAIVDTLEVLSNPEAMRAIRQAESGKSKWHSLGDLDRLCSETR